MVTVGRRAYDLMYRFGAPWEGADRVELRALVRDGRCSPDALRQPGAPAARAIDLGCGSGNVSLELAEAGFEVTGVDFSSVALRKARDARAARGLGEDRVRFVQGDLTAGRVEGVDGQYDLLVDYGTLDDLPDQARSAMAAYVARLARPGARFFLFAFTGRPEDLPRFSFGGPSRAFPGLLPGEVSRLFAPAFRVTVIDAPAKGRPIGVWLLERTQAPAPAVSPGHPSESGDAAMDRVVVDPGRARLAGICLYASGAAAAVGIVFLAGMFAAFADGDLTTGRTLGSINDALVLASYALVAPAILVLHPLLRPAGPRLADAIRLAGLAGVAGVVALQGLLLLRVLTFEQQIGPVALLYWLLAAWFIIAGRLASKVGLVRRGALMGLLAASYVGYPIWALWMARTLRSLGARPVAGHAIAAASVE